MNKNIKLVLFDLGGVLLELNKSFIKEESELADQNSEAFWQYWLDSDTVKAFDKGLCEPDTFIRTLIKDLKLSVSEEQLFIDFKAWLKGLYPGALELVADLKAKGYTVGCLSNTNAVHWPEIMEMGLEGQFEYVFASHLVHEVKPHREIYEIAEKLSGFKADEILFIDDNQVNVDGARACSWHAELCKGTKQAREIFEGYGLL